MCNVRLPKSPIRKVPMAATNHDNCARMRTIEVALLGG
jgi:hypothetical protein